MGTTAAAAVHRRQDCCQETRRWSTGGKSPQTTGNVQQAENPNQSPPSSFAGSLCCNAWENSSHSCRFFVAVTDLLSVYISVTFYGKGLQDSGFRSSGSSYSDRVQNAEFYQNRPRERARHVRGRGLTDSARRYEAVTSESSIVQGEVVDIENLLTTWVWLSSQTPVREGMICRCRLVSLTRRCADN